MCRGRPAVTGIGLNDDATSQSEPTLERSPNEVIA
jgi:hypothetical protein